MHKVTSRNSLSDKSRTEGNESLDSSAITPNMELDDWRRAISTPTRYRVGSASIHMKPREVLQLLVIFIVVVVVVFFVYKSSHHSTPVSRLLAGELPVYNNRYPLTDPITVNGGVKYRIGIISDLDHDSKVNNDNLWRSHFLKGYLTVKDDKSFVVEFESTPTDLHSSLAQGGRGMELSELVVFDGKVITVDDRTGVVYKIMGDQVVPWVILSDGNGDVSKGFKSEWATVKAGFLYIGGLGKEWTSTTGEVLNHNPQFVKKISPDGSVEHINWHNVYDKIRGAAGFSPPGYMIHESAAWSEVHRRWHFLPRRASQEKYDDKLDERRATNILITCDESCSDVKVTRPFGPHSSTHGFSSFKFIPNSNDELILALKSEEDAGKTASYIMVLDRKGNVLMKEKQVGNFKYEGVEFI